VKEFLYIPVLWPFFKKNKQTNKQTAKLPRFLGRDYIFRDYLL